jgi:flagellar FliJ protein
MKKGFKYKLEGLLKLRSFKEEQCKQQLGHINVLLEKKKEEIQNENSFIADGYTTQESMLDEGVTGNNLHFFPMYFEGKRNKIIQLQAEQAGLEEAINEKREEWIQYRADLKLIEKLKEKEFIIYKKELNKKIDKNLEETVSIWTHHNKSKNGL